MRYETSPFPNTKGSQMKIKKLLGGLVGITLTAVLVPVVAGQAGASSLNPDFGYLASQTSTTQVTGITGTERELTTLRRNFSVSDPNFFSRQVQVLVSLRMRAEGAPAAGDVYIDLTDLNTNPVQTRRIGGSSIFLPETSAAGATTLFVRGLTLARVSSYTVSVKVRRTAGTGTLTASYTLGGPQMLLVEDLGS